MAANLLQALASQLKASVMSDNLLSIIIAPFFKEIFDCFKLSEFRTRNINNSFWGQSRTSRDNLVLVEDKLVFGYHYYHEAGQSRYMDNVVFIERRVCPSIIFF